MSRTLYVGLMSGTSLDAVDAAVVEFGDERGSVGEFGDERGSVGETGDERSAVRVLASASIAIPPDLHAELRALQHPGHDELARAALAANRLADLYAEAVRSALAEGGVARERVAAIGCHGQTVRHRPHEGYTLQIANPARLAEATSIAVVADFRSRDVAAGGEGAPLVPAFHAAVFGRRDRHRVVVNVGGIANVTDLPPAGPVRGWDTGPGNVLLDEWARRRLGAPFDDGGRFARSGCVDAGALQSLLAEPYFARRPPKSTGRDLFDAGWLDDEGLGRAGLAALAPADVQATLTELTVATIADAIAGECAEAVEVLVCGGGARNAALMEGLARRLAPRAVGTTDAAGLPSRLVEPAAFAWLACCRLRGEPASLPGVTGAKGPRVLGAVWPA